MSRMKTVRIEDLIFDEELYPRMKVSFVTAYQYSQAMRSGSVFPPVLVGSYMGKLYLIDGWHRVRAKEILGEKYIQAKIKKYDSIREMFLDAVKYNSQHGRPLSIQEKARIIHKLATIGLNPEEISQIVHVPVDKLETFAVRVLIGPDGNPIYLKSTLVKAKTPTEKALTVNQSKLTGHPVENLIDQLIELLSSDAIPYENAKIKTKLTQLYMILQEKLEVTITR